MHYLFILGPVKLQNTNGKFFVILTWERLYVWQLISQGCGGWNVDGGETDDYQLVAFFIIQKFQKRLRLTTQELNYEFVARGISSYLSGCSLRSYDYDIFCRTCMAILL